ncbi:MAG: TonB-dependent receptor plug domain-containing protein, partial [Myxococcaceae bacterium]
MTPALLALASLLLAQKPERPEDAPRAFQTIVTGVRTPRPVVESPTTVTVIPRRELQRSPNQTVDNVLRTVPSVATFRRSTSLSADPSSQGVNLRGIGPSAISRTLVLLDGLPVNDPFGGWVYWRSLPKLSLQRLEVAPGGSSAQYGSSALGGVIQLVSRPIEERALDAEGSFGSFWTADGAVRGAARFGGIGIALEGDALQSQGFVPVATNQRGAIDRPAASRHLTGDARLEVQTDENVTLHFRARGFDEAQNGGTALTTAQVWTNQLGLGASVNAGEFGTVNLDLFSGNQRFLQQRARIGPNRSSETLSATQNTPSSNIGAAAVWSSPVWWAGGRHSISAGADFVSVNGEAREFFETGALSERRSGGIESFGGLFVQDLYRPTNRIDILGALRGDVWSTYDGSRTTIARQTGDGTDVAFDSKTERELSPRLAARVQLTDPVAVRASIYRAFRAPTLNELYRPFQV